MLRCRAGKLQQLQASVGRYRPRDRLQLGVGRKIEGKAEVQVAIALRRQVALVGKALWTAYRLRRRRKSPPRRKTP